MPHRGVNGLHHITAIAGPAQENVDFYAGILGMHLVKRSVNQDDPGTYHLFYADAEGSPGTDLTFFPWTRDAPPRFGHGLAVETSLEIPAGSLEYWGARLERYGVRVGPVSTRFGDRDLPVVDTHGFRLSLVESAAAPARPFTPWDGSSVPPERQIRGLYGARLWERERRRHEPISHGRARLRAPRRRTRMDAVRVQRRRRLRGRPRDTQRAARRLGRGRRAPSGLARGRRRASAGRASAGRSGRRPARPA